MILQKAAVISVMNNTDGPMATEKALLAASDSNSLGIGAMARYFFKNTLPKRFSRDNYLRKILRSDSGVAQSPARAPSGLGQAPK
ncbi:MAG: hypothetical protein JXR70_11520 [Spirochaetales bacterium]|nr:hypothetical protein [Spirochaetales bacterium]